MQEIKALMQERARQLLLEGTVDQVLAWKQGEFFYDNSPASFKKAEEVENLEYGVFCPANLSKYLIEASQRSLKTAVFTKPCDTYGLNQLLQDNRVKRELVLAIGTPCSGMLDINKLRSQVKLIKAVEVQGDEVKITGYKGEVTVAKDAVLLDKCRMCKGNAYKIADEEIGTPLATPVFEGDKMAGVKAIEAMSPAERFAFWQQELSKCIRCNACRDICPACSCEQCIFDCAGSAVAGKANADKSEEQIFHIIRAFHVAGRCTGCGECARVCPQGIKLGLLNMKLMKDINSFYGSYQAGAVADGLAPQVSYTLEDPEPNDTVAEGRAKHV